VADLSATHIPPSRARKQLREEEALRLRRTGLSYRAIGSLMGISHERVRELCEAAFQEVGERTITNKAELLGEELDRMDGLVRQASAIMSLSGTTPTEKLHAIEAVWRCSEAKVRWTRPSASTR
jgi:DNA-binding CsgD family transcriptional regulator